MKNSISIFIAAGVVLLTSLVVWHGQQPAPPKEATWDDVLIEAEDGGYRLITTEKLAQLYTSDPENILLVDTRQEWEYRTGHIAGSENFPMEPTWWSRWHRAGDLEDLLGPDKEVVLIFY